LEPEQVAARIVRAIEAGETDVPSAEFTDDAERRV
jgi:hypothetical protein